MRRLKSTAGLVMGVVLMAGALFGCSTVKPYEREFLADRIMDYQQDAREERLDQKWLEAREGSTGGAIGAGGGCACN